MSNIATWFRRITGQGPAPAVRADSGLQGSLGEFVASLSGRKQISMRDFDRMFKGWVYSCVHKRGAAIANQTVRVYTRAANKDGGRTLVDSDHPLVKLFEEPLPMDPFITPYDIWSGLEEWIDITGEAYIYTPRYGGKYPVQMWPIPSHQVIPKSEGKRIIDYFEWYSSRGTTRINPEEMLFFRESAPGRTMIDNLVRGFSRLEAAFDQVVMYTRASEYVQGDLESGGIPPFFVTSKDVEDLPEWKRWQAHLMESYKGPAGDRKPGMLHKGWDIKTVDLLENKGPILELMKHMGEVICAIFGVPMSIVTGNYGTQAPATLAQEIHASFEQYEIAPQLARYDAVLTRWARSIDKNLVIAHDPIEWKDSEKVQADELHRLKTGQATIDMLRQENGIELLGNEIGTQLWIDPGLLPINQVLTGSANALPVPPTGGDSSLPAAS